MSLSAKELTRLISVLDTAFQAEQAKAAETGRQIDLLKERLSALKGRPPVAGSDGFAPATLAGADIRWLAWAEARRKVLNTQLAQLMQERERRQTALALAFGKLQAAETMRDRALAEAARKARRDQL